MKDKYYSNLDRIDLKHLNSKSDENQTEYIVLSEDKKIKKKNKNIVIILLKETFQVRITMILASQNNSSLYSSSYIPQANL